MTIGQLFLPLTRLREQPAIALEDLTAMWCGLGIEPDEARARAEQYHQARSALIEGDLRQIRGYYERLFATGERAPINEAAYIRRDKGALLGDIAGFYTAFGMAVSPGIGERPDHLVCELEFLSLVFVMMANAQTEPPPDQPDAAETCWQAVHSFADDHLGEWLPSFAARTAFDGEDGPYALAAEQLVLLWRSMCQLLAIPYAREDLMPQEEPTETEWDCAGGDGKKSDECR